MAINISGIDENIFIDLFDGDEELFVSVLRSFVNKTPAVLSKLATVSNETLADYAMTVHGIKGGCANICAEEARKMALSLEQKSKTGDLSGVLADNGAFLKYMENLLNDLQNWLKNRRK